MNQLAPDPAGRAVPLGGVEAAPVDLDGATRQTSVYVYEAPVRIWHWINALAIVVLAVTGYLIGSPPPSMQIGEAAHQFVFGYIRFAHFAAGLVLTLGFFGRIYWGLVGNHHARQLFYVPVWQGRWWREVWIEIKWYLFLAREPRKYVGHNPLAQLAMFVFITLGLSFMIVTGLALYAEGLGYQSWLYALTGWVFTAVGGNSMVVHTLHHLGMWWILLFVMIHVYVAIREDMMSRQSIVSTMISGHRTFKDDRPV